MNVSAAGKLAASQERAGASRLSMMAEPIVIAHLVGEQGERVCSTPDMPMAVDFTPAAWAVHMRRDSSQSVIRCGRCSEFLRLASGAPPLAA